MRQWHAALNLLQQSRDTLRVYDDKENFAYVLLKLGNCQRNLGMSDALTNLERSLAIGK